MRNKQNVGILVIQGREADLRWKVTENHVVSLRLEHMTCWLRSYWVRDRTRKYKQ